MHPLIRSALVLLGGVVAGDHTHSSSGMGGSQTRRHAPGRRHSAIAELVRGFGVDDLANLLDPVCRESASLGVLAH